MQGRLITLEGGEGAGKSTQARLLAVWLADRGITARLTREPGGTPGAEAIRELLLQGSENRWTAKTEALLVAAARADHAARLIRPELEAGHWVICDRFLDSTLAYQGGASGLPDKSLISLHDFATGGLRPDMTLILTLPAEIAAARAAARDKGQADRFGMRGAAFHAAVEAAFHRQLQADPQRCREINAVGGENEVSARIITNVSELLP